MKALLIDQEADPQGTVTGVPGVLHISASPIPPFLWSLALTAAILLLAFACLQISGDAFLLQESGHFSGSGYHMISASGPMCNITVLPANESILAASNGTVWKVLSNGTLQEVA